MADKQQQQIANTFLASQNELKSLIQEIQSNQSHEPEIQSHLNSLFTKLTTNLADAFKPKGAPAASKELFSQSLFAHSKVEFFTYNYLEKLIESFKQKIMPLHSANLRGNHYLIENLTELKKLVEFLDHVERSKLSSGEKFLNEFNHKLLSLNDNSILVELITVYGLGSGDFKMDDFIGSNNELTQFKIDTIQALDNLLKTAPSYEKMMTMSP